MIQEQTAEIVAAYLSKNSVSVADVPNVIGQVYQALARLGQPVEPETLTPAVPIKRSVGEDFIVCLECGAKSRVLRRHLQTAHNLTPQGYRERWKLPKDYPLVAPSYSVRRSAMAKAVGLGRKGKGRKRRSVRTAAAA
jgi:predicted transcriptional regulator